MEFPVKVAVATKEGKGVREHFGHAKRFAIYEVTPESVSLLEAREVSHYCLGCQGNGLVYGMARNARARNADI